MKKTIICALIASFYSFYANAYEYKFSGNTVRLSLQGTAGVIGSDNFNDYAVRLQASRMIADDLNAGVVYSIDKSAADKDYIAKDAFGYAEAEWGRVEIGWTESIAAKMALVLPDVGASRLNNAAFFYQEEFVGITNPAIRGNQYAWRMNFATMPTNPWQAGIGAGFGDNFKYSADMGIRYRSVTSRVKTSVSFGLSYIDKPKGLIGDSFLSPAFADARYQFTTGFNLQFGSLVWGVTGKAVIDDGKWAHVPASDGMSAGTGFSYDFLSWSASANYIFSSVNEGVFAHTGIFSSRYKINPNFNVWGSMGIVDGNKYDDKFFMAGLGFVF